MEGHSVISADILASYVADAARGVEGVRGVVEGSRPRHHGVKVSTTDAEGVAVELHLAVDWGANVAEVGRGVQMRVAECLSTMADLTPVTVDVIVDEVGPRPEGAPGP